MTTGYQGDVPAPVALELAKEAESRQSSVTHLAGGSDLLELQKVADLQPSKETIFELAGEENITRNPDGTWTANVPPEKRGLLHDLHHRQLMAEGERGDKVNAGIPHVTVRRAGDGRQVQVAAGNEDLLGRRFGSRKVRRFKATMLKRFSDGLLYRGLADGRWEGTGRCALGAPLFPCTNPACFWCGRGYAVAIDQAKGLGAHAGGREGAGRAGEGGAVGSGVNGHAAPRAISEDHSRPAVHAGTRAPWHGKSA
jgi:hypothetical protein